MLVNIHRLPFSLAGFLTVATVFPALPQVWTMQQCVDSAQTNNQSVLISRNNILIGEQRYIEAQANLLPKISVNAEYRYYTNQPFQLMPLSTFGGGPAGKFKETQFGVPHNISTNLQVTMPIYNPQIFGAIQTSKIALEISELQSQKSEEQIYFEIRNLYYNAQIVKNQLIFIDSNMVNLKKLLINIVLLKNQMLARGTDVSKVELQLAQLSTQKELVKSKYAQILNSLKFAMGLSIDRILEIDPIIQFQNDSNYTKELTLDIRFAKAQYHLVSGELNAIRNSRLPSLSIFGTYGTTGFGYDKAPNEFLKFFSVGFIGVQLSYPLFDGTVTRRKINQKEIELLNSEMQQSTLVEQNTFQIENAILQRAVSRLSIETIVRQIQLAQTVYQQTLLQQREGTASLTDILLADNAIREAQQSYLSAVIDYLKADLEYKKLTGNISTSKRSSYEKE